MISKKTLYLTADRVSVVEEGDPKAASLLVRAGQELPDTLAEKYGVSDTGKRKPDTGEKDSKADIADKIDKRHTRVVKGESHR